MKPTGAVTALFTDIEGSTRLSQEYPDTFPAAVERHHKILREAFESNNGFVFEIVGDAFCCTFQKPEDAVKAAVLAQQSLIEEKWTDAVIKVRIGIHSGHLEWSGEKYVGYITMARTARIMSAAYGNQILISENVHKELQYNPKVNFSYRHLGTRRLKDLIQPMNLFQVVAPVLPDDFPPLKTLDARPNNLPVQLTNFIGRENDISEIRDMLSASKLLTLIGPGGTGKTRLALQVSADLIDEFSNGVWIAELAPLSDPLLILYTISEALGIGGRPNEDIEITITEYLKEKEILIILDNCEHLIDNCARLSESLLMKCPKLKIIATSREALRCNGETTYKVVSLDHPDPLEIYTPLQLSQYEAVRLFIERALAVNSDFRVNNENAPALAQICFQLDGIPLAIELAAVRIKVMSVEKICERLADRFKLLTGGKRTSLPRQQTLRALIDWSYDILSEKEKILLQRLSVFSGGWTLEQAEEICSFGEIEKYEILDLLIMLQDKSLLNSTEKEGAMRFNMLETIRQYSREKLTDHTELDRRHLTYFKKVADNERTKADGVTELEWIKLVESDQNNIRSAIDWAVLSEINEASIVVSCMTEFWNIKGRFTEGLQASQKVLGSTLPLDDFHKVLMIYSAGLMSQNLGHVSEAKSLISEGLILARRIDFKFGIAKCLNILGVISRTDPKRKAEGKQYLEEAISLFRELDRKSDIAVSIYNLSYALADEGKHEESLKCKLESLSIHRQLNESHYTALCLATLSVYELRRKEFEKARSYAEESLSISKEYDDKYLISIDLVILGSVFSGQGEYEKAYSLIDESLLMLKENGYKSNTIVALYNLGEVSIKLGYFGKAINFLKESISICRETGNYYFLATCINELAISYFMLSKLETSLKHFRHLKNLTDNAFDPIGADRLEAANDYINKIREKLGDESYQRIAEESNETNKEEIIAYALDEKLIIDN